MKLEGQSKLVLWDNPEGLGGEEVGGDFRMQPGKESCAFSPIWILKEQFGILNYDNQMAKSLHFSPRF